VKQETARKFNFVSIFGCRIHNRC